MAMTSERAHAQGRGNEAVKKMVLTAFMAALITLLTAYICHVPIGINEGYIHFGDAFIYIAAAILPTPYAMAAGAIGAGLADLLTAPVWAPATIIIKLLLVLPFTSKENKVICKRNVMALFMAFVILVSGYFLAEGVMFGFKAALLTSVLGNVIQASGSAAIFILFGTALDRMNFKTRFLKNS